MVLPAFYKDCEIFVTGGSGVVGKALIEKLLRSCDVRRIYLLLRTKKGIDVERRLDKIRNDNIFRLLRSQDPAQLQKLVAIPGDVALPNLGITPEYAKILENVSIVFHSAATVRFDEPLGYALKLNVGGTFEALKFAETLKQLKIFMHVSTFYSNPYLKRVEPRIYSSPMDWRMCLELLHKESKHDLVDILTDKLIAGFPNTYTFTKNLSESVVMDFRDRIPVAIFRPSIVLFSFSEPIPGYPGTIMGITGLFALMGAGILKTIYIGKNARLDLTPQDVCIKTMLYFAWRGEQEYRKGTPESVPVFLCSSCKHFPYTFNYLLNFAQDNNMWEEVAFEKSLLIPGVVVTSSRIYYMFLIFTKQLFPALIADLLLKIAGQKPVIMGIMRKVYITLEVMKPFMFKNYESDGHTDFMNIVKVTQGTEFSICEDLNFSNTHEGLIAYGTASLYNTRELLLNENPATLARARKILKIKRILWNVVRAIMAYFILRWIYRAYFVDFF